MDPKAAEHLRPAYPVPSWAETWQQGMTMRDAFAIAALPQVMTQNPNWGDLKIAEGAYSIADAMIQAREV